MPTEKLIPVLNVNAYAEGYFAKSASLGVSPEEALALMTKSSGLTEFVSKYGVPILVGGEALRGAGSLVSGAKDIVGAGASAAVNAPSWMAELGLSGKELAMLGVGAGAGVGGLGWLLRQNAQAEAKKKIAGQQAAGQVNSQQDQLRKAFAPAPEEKVKSYSTVGQPSGYEV